MSYERVTKQGTRND